MPPKSPNALSVPSVNSCKVSPIPPATITLVPNCTNLHLSVSVSEYPPPLLISSRFDVPELNSYSLPASPANNLTFPELSFAENIFFNSFVA